MDGGCKTQHGQLKPRISFKKEGFSEGVLRSVKTLLKSRKELCSVSAGDYFLESDQDHLIKELAATFVELPDLLKSLHLYKLNDNEVIFLKDAKKPWQQTDGCIHQNPLSRILCVMRTSPTFPRVKIDSIFNLLSKYTTSVRYIVDLHSLNKLHPENSHPEDDDTNQSVSSIEDDFVTAFEHLDEEEIPAANEVVGRGFGTSRPQRDVASQTVPAHCLNTPGSKIIVSGGRRKSSSSSLVNIFALKQSSTCPLRNSVTTSVSDVWKQRSFCRPCSAAKQEPHLLHKTIVSPSPPESSESDCSSPSPIIFLDEEGYQKSLKATLELPKIPVTNNDIEDSDSEVSEFFDSFDQFDDSDHCSENTYNLMEEAVRDNSPQKRKHAKDKSCSTGMNPHRFKFDRPILPADIRKPTPRKPKSPFASSHCDAPDSPLPVQTSGDDAGALFSPISSAFSPMGSCTTADCFYRRSGCGDSVGQKIPYPAGKDFADNVSFKILGSALKCHSKIIPKRRSSVPCLGLVVSKEHHEQAVKVARKSAGKETDRTSQKKHRPLLLKGSIQKFATDLVEKSFGSAFKDLQRGVSSCTNALCHLASKLTSSVFQMAFYEIGLRQAFSLKERAISGLASFMVSEAVSSALCELQCVKKQMFTNTVARFAADLAEELVFEGIMEVCQFSQPSTPTTAHHWSFDYENKVVKSYAKDLSESVIQEAFIELSQVDVTFTTQAAISVSLDNIKYVSAESMLQSTQTCTVSPNFPDCVLTSFNPSLEHGKEYTVQHALFFTSGVVSSISVPLAGSALCQQPTIFDGETKGNICSVQETPEMCTDFGEDSDVTVEKKEVGYGCLSLARSCTTNTSPIDLKHRNMDVSSFSETAIKPKGLPDFSGNMVDMIVNEAFDVISSTNVTKTVDEYADYLTRKIVVKPASYQNLSFDRSPAMYADRLAAYIVKQSVDASTSMQTSESKVQTSDGEVDIGVQICESSKHNYETTNMQSKQMPLKVPVSEFSSCQSVNTHSVLNYYPDEHKGHVADILSSLEPYVAIKKCGNEGDINPEFFSTKCVHKPLQNGVMQNLTMDSSMFEIASFSPEIHCDSSLLFSSGKTLQMEGKLSSRDAGFGTLPDPPPPTPLVASQVRAERNLRKVTKKLKAELAKEFSPATPPSTPRNPPVTGHEPEQKEEFMLKLVTSLSEEVESSEEEEQSEVILEKSEKTAEYADNLANQIVSMATEMASFYLDDKSGPQETDKQSILAVLNERWGYPTCMKNITEDTLSSLWNYATDMAADVLNEAKKTAVKKQRKLLRLKRVNCSVDGLCRRRNSSDCRPSERICSMTDPWSREVSGSLLSLPLSSVSAGLTSKYPSCESVTDEYAGHVIKVLKKEGANSEEILDQYASRLAYRSIKSGLQQAAWKMKRKCSKSTFVGWSTPVTTAQDGHMLLNKDYSHAVDAERQTRNGMNHCCGVKAWESSDDMPRNECTDLLHFAESLAHSITCDVRRKLKMSAVCLPKSLTDSCLYKRSTIDEVAGDILKSTFSKTLLPFSEKHKLYHSTGSLNEYGYSEGFIQAIEQYARKVVDDTLELSLGSLGRHVTENKNNVDGFQYSEKESSISASDCRYCNVKDHHYSVRGACHLPGQAPSSKIKHLAKPKHNNCGQKQRIVHIEIPKIHIDPEQRAVFAEKIVTAAIEKAERELSNTSLAADSGIGQDAVSFAESLTTEIMTSAMTNIGQTFNISSLGKDGFQSAETLPNQQLSLSVGDDSTGSWSNLSFEDEHPDESSSFLHLSDSNGNSSSWSSLGLEGDMYEENVSFPPSDSDGAEEKDEEPKEAVDGHPAKVLLIKNIDMESATVDPHLRIALQWAVASEFEVSELGFQDTIPKDFLALSKRLREKEWKVGDLLHALLKYCEMMEKASESERGSSKPLFGWLLDNV
ncbi:A-kinase anchor protein 11 isoform X2 [Ambystoma mexicanum]|uniref:A-kinase anchor protein 11 isoform X2 n=1 Tax=Ambystoma mexicanum TaxID=8296 RepID=UPI0037E7877D